MDEQIKQTKPNQYRNRTHAEVSSDGLIDILSFAWVAEINNENHSGQSVLLLRLETLIAEYKPEILSSGPNHLCFNVQIIGT